MWTDLKFGPLLEGQMMVPLALVSSLSVGYKFASVLQCVGVVLLWEHDDIIVAHSYHTVSVRYETC